MPSSISWQQRLRAEISDDITLTDAQDIEARQQQSIRLKGKGHAIGGSLKICTGTNINGAIQQQGQVLIGRYCAIGAHFSAISGNHRTDRVNINIRLQESLGFARNHKRGSPIVVGHNVWMGTRVTLLSGVTIGSGAVIGAGAVVTQDVPPFAIMGGIPAKMIRYRFSENIIQQLLQIAWWHWSPDRMQRNPALFNVVIPENEDIDILCLVQP